MSTAELITTLAQRGIRLEVRGDQIRYYPRSAVTPDLLARLRACKAALLAMLRPTGKAPAIDRSDAAAVWQTALELLDGDPLFPPELMDALRAADVRWIRQPAPGQPVATSDTAEKPTKPVCRCGSTTWRDVPIHAGRSVRRDCDRCGRFLDFPVWCRT